MRLELGRDDSAMMWRRRLKLVVSHHCRFLQGLQRCGDDGPALNNFSIFTFFGSHPVSMLPLLSLWYPNFQKVKSTIGASKFLSVI